ncbi:dienelactone hydrolase family protein [Nodosilinea sp. FACHB-131]|uniref:dienelactone hydrolase family protein n=1 Tax=Cyanophyceae TaxID=3028117 RepID=UPI0016877022|nr:dienelactone hydrolase family protein [Nodosilinea sp. FACHB-131]MBD1873868.1 dienelactone hydrolase family protein [Nodosilinea sp. FACHB-131]
MGDMISFNRPDGQSCQGYYVEPASGSTAPGIVVIQEWWGLNDQIKGVADQLVQQGYRVLVPDLYKGEVTVETAEAEHLMGNLDFGDAATQNIRGAVQHLKADSPKVAVLGYCMGGALTVLAAVYVPEADVAVCWYGVPPAEAADTRTISIPFQGHFAEQDEFFPPDQVKAFEARLREGGVNYESYWYDAHHAFGNENNDIHDPEATKLAWERSLTFLATHLA